MMDKHRFGRFKSFAVFGVFCGLLAIGCRTAALPPDRGLATPGPSPALAPTTLYAALTASEAMDGAVLLVNVNAPDATPEQVTAEFEGTVLPLYPVPEKGSHAFQAIVGVPFGHKPGLTKVVVKIGTAAAPKILDLPLAIKDGKYRSEILRVNPRTVKLRKKDLLRVQREAAEIGQIYRRITKLRYWQSGFILPLAENKVTSPYGTKRVYNGEMQSFHQGADLKAALKTPVHASAPGVVVLAKDLFLTGWTVLVDHGYGVFTVYAHMSKLNVSTGQAVQAGQMVGLSGMTGRSSGPHLHWGAVIHRVKVNPFELTQIQKL